MASTSHSFPIAVLLYYPVAACQYLDNSTVVFHCYRSLAKIIVHQFILTCVHVPVSPNFLLLLVYLYNYPLKQLILAHCFSFEDVATVEAVKAVLRGDGIMGNMSVFLECKLTTDSMITSKKDITILVTALVCGCIG